MSSDTDTPVDDGAALETIEAELNKICDELPNVTTFDDLKRGVEGLAEVVRLLFDAVFYCEEETDG